MNILNQLYFLAISHLPASTVATISGALESAFNNNVKPEMKAIGNIIMYEINIAMSTSREFAMILRHRADRLDDARRSIMQTLNLIREHQFHARIATKDSFKRLLAIYYVGDIYTEHVPDFDGMQYMEVNNATI